MNSIKRAVQALNDGGLVIMPTETVYGLAADAGDSSAVARIFEAKGRPQFNPLIAHVSDRQMAAQVGRLSPLAAKLADRFWPGPLTLVVPILDPSTVCDLARAGLDTVALRAPAHPMAQDLIQSFGRPLCAPSANRSGRPSPTNFADAFEETGQAAAAALDGGPCRIGLESTVVAVHDETLRLLRPGGLERAEIEALCGPLSTGDEDAHRSPGRLALHYAPNALVRLGAAQPRPGEAYLAFGPPPARQDGQNELNFSLSEKADLREAAANLFATLRAADRLNPSAIAVAPIPERGLGEAINDRLKRAAGFVG